MSIGIIVDTSVWIDFFNHPQAPLTLYVKTLLRNRQVILVGMVLAEILQGIKNPKEASTVQQSLEKLPFLEMTREDWKKAGDLSATLRRKGLTIPLSDLIIGALAVKESLEILTTDPHFKKIPGLKIHQPQASG
jgi:predicted nucleic acid-binding protein